MKKAKLIRLVIDFPQGKAATPAQRLLVRCAMACLRAADGLNPGPMKAKMLEVRAK